MYLFQLKIARRAWTEINADFGQPFVHTQIRQIGLEMIIVITVTDTVDLRPEYNNNNL